MSLMESRQLVWDEIIEEMNHNWEHVTLMHKEKVGSKDYEQSIMNAKEEGENNSQIAKRFICFVNEIPTEEVRPVDIVDRVSVVIEISKSILREESRVRAEQCLGVAQKEVASFNVEFDRVVQVGLPNCWGSRGEFLSQEQYNQRLVKAKSKASLSHEKTATLKEKIVVNFLKKEFQLLGMVRSLFHHRLNYSSILI